MTLSGAEEDSGEGGDNLLDLGGVIGNKVALLPTLNHIPSLSSLCTAIHPTLTVMQTLSYPNMQAQSTTSTGGAAVASSFNFTKAAEMRATAMQRRSPASPASAPVRPLQPGTESRLELAGRAAKAGTPLPAHFGGSMSGGAPLALTPASSTQGAGGGVGPAQATGGTAGVFSAHSSTCLPMHACYLSKHRIGRCKGLHHHKCFGCL